MGGQFFVYIAAPIAGLGGWGQAVHYNVPLSLLLQLVLQAQTEHPKAGVLPTRLLELLGELHQVRFPHAHGIPSVGYPPGFLVDEVATLVGNMLVLQPHLLQLLFVVFRSMLHSGEFALHFG